QRGQALRSLAEVDRLRCDHDADRAGRADHEPPFNAPITAAIVLGLAPVPTRTTTPSISISIRPLGLLAAAAHAAPPSKITTRQSSARMAHSTARASSMITGSGIPRRRIVSIC
ncbi:hypothetical protein, partial [Bosea sp. AAP35]|uniref:hypothetical protein n=1 Tax=Bosea sp. AAP35 TaxID=1523417 RepID=UPI001AEC1C9B